MEPMTTEGHLLHALRRFHEVAPPQHVRQLQMRHEIQSLQFWRATIGECLATFFLTFLVCAAVVPWGGATGAAATAVAAPAVVVQVALTAGFVATTLNHCFGHVSGGYMNPAVTLAFVTLRKMTVFRGALYIVAQCGGAIAGAALLYSVTKPPGRGHLGMTMVTTDQVSPLQAFGLELVLTFVLTFTYLAAYDCHRRALTSASMVIGAAVGLAHFILVPLTGCGINPARSFGPAFVMSAWKNHWVYWAGPMGGAFLAGLVYELLFDPKRNFKNTDDLLKESDRDVLAAAAAKNVNYMRRSHSAQSHATVSTLMQPASATSTMQRLRTFERYGRDNIAYDAASVCPSNIELAEAMTPRGGATGDLAADEDSRSGCHSSAYSSSSGVCV